MASFDHSMDEDILLVIEDIIYYPSVPQHDALGLSGGA